MQPLTELEKVRQLQVQFDSGRVQYEDLLEEYGEADEARQAELKPELNERYAQLEEVRTQLMESRLALAKARDAVVQGQAVAQ